MKKRKKTAIEETAVEEIDVEELEEQQVIELPPREAFSLVFSSPTLLQAGGVIDQAVPPESETSDVTPE